MRADAKVGTKRAEVAVREEADNKIMCNVENAILQHVNTNISHDFQKPATQETAIWLPPHLVTNTEFSETILKNMCIFLQFYTKL